MKNEMTYDEFLEAGRPKSITAITEWPDGLTSIGCAAFYGCSGLAALTLPDGLTEIGGSAFRGCAGLTALTLRGYPVLTTSRGFTAYFAGGDLAIGCERHRVEWWVQNVEKIAAKHELEPSEKEELSKLIEMYEK